MDRGILQESEEQPPDTLGSEQCPFFFFFPVSSLWGKAEKVCQEESASLEGEGEH